ncbi:MAG: type I-E CRISPR-associated protein Cas7/Cse4/CasC [Verrucomicrobiales bacterium]
MKLLELHILQSYPVSCLNRDDVGAPKSANFGGVPRARISSQCLKRAVRTTAASLSEGFHGIRSRFLLGPFQEALKEAGLEEKDAQEKAQALAELFSKQDGNKPDQVTTSVYLSPGEIQQIAKAVAGGEDLKKAIRQANRLDAADIALFGRMIANDATLNVEGAAMFSHALSTHKASNDIDFFSTVDDRKGDAEDAGASMIGTLEFNSATYYRFAAVNLDLLASDQHLGKLEAADRRKVLEVFLRATLLAVPGARQNSMNSATLPSHVLGVRKDEGQPVQLINAFEAGVRTNGKGLLESSLEAMKAHYENLKTAWGMKASQELWMPDCNLETFITGLTNEA